MRQATQLSITREILNLSIPNSLAQLVRLLGVFVATLMVSRLGVKPLAGNALAYTFYLNALLFITGISFALGILVAKHHGANEKDKVSLVFSQTLVLAFLLFIPLFFLFHFSFQIFIFFGQNVQIARLAQSYLHAFIWGIFPWILSSMWLQFLLGLGHAKLLRTFAVTGTFFSIVSFYLLIFGHAGLPRLGLAGVGYGLSISAGLNTILMFCYMRRHKELGAYIRIAYIFRVDIALIKNILQVGVPISLNLMVEILAITGIVFVIGYVNHAALAAYQVVSQLMYIPLMFPFAAQQSCAVLVSRFIGKQEHYRIAEITRKSIFMTLILVGIFSLIFWFMPLPLIHLFIHKASTQQLVPLIKKMLWITAAVQLFDGVRLVGVGALRGLKDVKKPLYYSIYGFLLINFPLACLVGLVFHAGVLYIWSCAAVGIIVGTFLILGRLRNLLHKQLI